MEKEGLSRALQLLKKNKLSIKVLVTDRHKQINKWLREKHPRIKHYYDVWHVVKGTSKNARDYYITILLLFVVQVFGRNWKH